MLGSAAKRRKLEIERTGVVSDSYRLLLEEDIDVRQDAPGTAYAASLSEVSSLWRKAAAVNLGDTLVLFTDQNGGTTIMSCKYLLGSSWKRV